MNDLRDRLAFALASAYTIERELGGGGMARVFLATERALDRRVVIKILSPELAAEVSFRRFEREIRLAASLQQANIVPVLSAGETDGLPHYTMPFVDGLSLRDRLAHGAPPVHESIGILRDIARALAYAHERGVVHRDIKPENILLSGDAAVVTDFGIAKAIASARRADGDADDPIRRRSTITQVGVSVGTPAYMAPEQIAADPAIDHRADIYAFGCVAYELFAGRPPFQAGGLQALFAAHLAETPAPLVQHSADVPGHVADLVMRCLAKAPAERPQSAREILQALQSGDASRGSLARLALRIPRRQRTAAFATLGVLVLATAAAVTLRAFTASDPEPSVAVIPFVNLGGDPADDYLGDGLADGLTTALGKVNGVRVVSRTLGYRYRGRRDLDAREVGRDVGVTHVLHGTIQRAGGRLRVAAQLISTTDNFETWSDNYDRDSRDAFAVQNEITRDVATRLPRKLAPGTTAELPATARSGTSDADAYDLYLRGRYLLQRRGAGVRQASEYFARAIRRDSNFAHAHAAYALAVQLIPYFERVRSIDSLNRIAIAAATRALGRDSAIAEAHTALGLAYQHQYDWTRAEDAYRRAVAAQPPDADAHIQYGRFLFYTRTVSEALPWFERAGELDPASAVAWGWVGHMYDLLGDVSRAMPHLRRALEIDSTNPPSLVMMSEAHLFAGRPDSARMYAERLARVWPGWSDAAALALATMGDRARALELLEQRRGAVQEDNAGVLAALGDSVGWYQVRERETAERRIWPTYWSLNERNVDFMRGSARFAAIVRSVGLDERIFTAPRGGRR